MIVRQRYTESFKRQVVEEYLRSSHSQSYLERKYDIGKNGAIRDWMRQLGYVDAGQKARYLPASISPSLASKKKKNEPAEPTASLQKRIKELERRLKDEQLRAEMYSRMIDITEQDLNITIRKKPDTE
jgi:transposase